MISDETVLVWPPTLDDLKEDLDIPLSDTRQDALLTKQLAAAMGFVRRVHAGRYEFADDGSSTLIVSSPPGYEFGTDAFAALSPLAPPGPEMVLGTIRLAGRWFVRRRSPDGVIAMGDVGTQNIPGFDSDLERMLEMGRYGGSMIV